MFDKCYDLTVYLKKSQSENIYALIPDYVKIINVDSNIFDLFQ